MPSHPWLGFLNSHLPPVIARDLDGLGICTVRIFDAMHFPCTLPEKYAFNETPDAFCFVGHLYLIFLFLYYLVETLRKIDNPNVGLRLSVSVAVLHLVY